MSVCQSINLLVDNILLVYTRFLSLVDIQPNTYNKYINQPTNQISHTNKVINLCDQIQPQSECTYLTL